jgi:hypothetical protein
MYSQCTETDHFYFSYSYYNLLFFSFFLLRTAQSSLLLNFPNKLIFLQFHNTYHLLIILQMKTYLFECIVALAHPLWKQNGILIFVKEKKFLCFEFESQNWQYELIKCQSHNIHLRYGISLCMPFYMRIHCIVLTLHSVHVTILNDAGQYWQQNQYSMSIHILYVPIEHCSWISWHMVSCKFRLRQNPWISIFEVTVLHEFSSTREV